MPKRYETPLAPGEFSVDLWVLYFAAMAAAVPEAFEALAAIVPAHRPLGRATANLENIEAWLTNWRLDAAALEDFHVADHARSWTLQMLDWWALDPEMMRLRRTDIGWWERFEDGHAVARPPDLEARQKRLLIRPRNPASESAKQYRERIRAEVEEYIASEEAVIADLEEPYGAQTSKRRAGKAGDLTARLEWVAMRHLKRLSYGQIAFRAGVQRQSVHRACIDLAAELGITVAVSLSDSNLG